MDVVVAVVAGQSDQDAGCTAALLLTTQAAVTHLTADGTRPSLQKRSKFSVGDLLLLYYASEKTIQVGAKK